ncbi:MAG: acyl-CoA dehydrogenase family protein [Firmicutes bacterium]|nr:acyl-CoA dehydrogenase family protein [Bacillota bacterium]
MQLAEKYELMRKLARDFATTELTPEILDQVEDTGIFPKDIQKKMADTGFYGIKVPVKYGGQGSDHLAYAITIEEFARVSAVGSLYVNSPNSLGGMPILIAGTEEQKMKYLKPMVQGEIVIPFGLTEPGGGSDAGGVRSTAKKDGDYYILNGRKTFITMAPFADYSVIYANTDPAKGAKSMTAFIVDMKLPGVSLGKEEQKLGLVGCATSDIILEDVRVHKDDILGEIGSGFKDAMKVLDVGRIGVAAQSLGVAQACLDEAIKYSKERKQFGKYLCEHQAIAFMLADMATKVKAARELVYDAAVTKDTGGNSTLASSMAKYYASEICNEVAAKALQIHGGYGFVRGFKIERLYRDCRVFTIYEGTSQVQQMVISSQILGK